MARVIQGMKLADRRTMPTLASMSTFDIVNSIFGYEEHQKYVEHAMLHQSIKIINYLLIF